MKAIIRHVLCTAALAVPPGVCAAEPASGRVLVIDYDRLIEGDVERIGNKFRIRQGGGEMSIPATPTMVLVADREAAYQLVKSRAKPGEPLARARLARWCLANGLNAQAVAEAEAALALRPDDRALKRFVEDVKLRAALAPPPSVPEAKAAPSAPKPAEPEPAAVEVGPEAFGLFVTKVQPLLMNVCVQCHGGERGGAFRLTRAASNYGDKRATQFNLAAATKFVNRERPASSPLLLRAVSAHGDCAQPPLRDRQSPAYQHLEEWVRLTTGKPLTLAPAAPVPVAAVVAPTTKAEVPAAAVASEPAKPAEAPAEKTEPSDPFDPILFNKPAKKP